MKNTRLIIRIVLLVLGVVVIWLSVRGLLDIPAYKNAIDSAVYLDEAVVLPENEGKMVIIHGKVEMSKSAYDEELGLTINSVKAFRYDEEYAKTSSENSTHKYNWVSRGSKSIVGEASVGEFVLDTQMMAGLPADDYYVDFDAQEISAYTTTYAAHSMGDRLYVLDGAEYYYDEFEYSTSESSFVRGSKSSIAQEREGSRAYAYKAYDESRHEMTTLAGIQQGNTLKPHEKIGAVVVDGLLTQEDLKNNQSGYLLISSLAFLVVGLVMIFFGLKKSGKKAAKKTA